MAIVLAVLALLVSLAAVGLTFTSRRTPDPSHPVLDTAGLPSDPRALRQEVAALKAESTQTMRHLAVVRYDAFADTGGQLSWSVALLDDTGSGIVLSAIQGRNESRSYAKNVSDWASDTQLSPEEESAISNARPTSD